ncbi:C40 family peptidase [Brumimicrobium aurantiacum]|uniref:Hydrolase Nlp/P60 n=1 Tax=Brumimicrobium aurantiacum TaxID=1737063 RepID=A0A3E1F0J2_9FLAO|nr:C40 family peptidase [Brumimicrobium aurantiacum]RFC55243.1 hydrolase Nlp/P60 [Brumimicrobium aurantiacum]
MNIGINAICGLTVIPVRADHQDTSEIVTQLLFGETVTIIEIHHQWVKIKIVHDQYEGWVDNKQLLKVSDSTFESLNKNTKRQHTDLNTLQTPWGKQHVLQGSPILSTSNNFRIDDLQFESHSNSGSNTVYDSLTEIALSYSNSPYLWGGRTAFGIDCSGFTQTVYHQMNYYLPRDASQQFLKGEPIAFDQQQPGDLAFFKSEKTGNIHHVGIILDKEKIIHAHGKVRIDTLNPEGVYNEDKKYYSHKFTGIKRYF